MSVRLLENTSFGLIRTNPKLTTNVKLVADSKGGIFLESFDANTELSKSKYKAFRVSSNSSYDFDLARFYKHGDGAPSNLIFDVFRESSDISINNLFDKQYEFFYDYGAESVESNSYSEEFGILAPIWLEKNIPDYFIIFRLDEPVSVNNLNVTDENSNTSTVSNPQNFVDLILKKSTIIKTFDLSDNTEIGKYIRNYRNSERFPDHPFTFNFEKLLPSTWNGIDIRQGGFTSKSEIVYNDFFGKDNTIIEDDFFVTQGFERNDVALANILNIEFLFDDKDVNDFTINRYYGLYVNAIQEGTFQLSGEKMYKDVKNEKTQTPKATSEFFLTQDNTKDLVQTNPNGIKVYLDEDSIATIYQDGDIDFDSIIDLNQVDFLPKMSDVNNLASIFYLQDKNGDFYNLKTGSTWTDGEQLRLAKTSVNWKNFTGIEEPILSTKGLLSDKKGIASTFLEVNSQIPDGDTYFAGIIKKQIYVFRPKIITPGDIFTIFDDTFNSISVNAVNNNVNDLLENLKTAWKNQPFGSFNKYSVSVENSGLVVFEKDYSGVDTNFTTSTSSTTSIFTVEKNISSDLQPYVIQCDNTLAPGETNANLFSGSGTNAEIAKAMTIAFNFIKDKYYNATTVGNKIVLLAKTAGRRFNDIAVGRDIFLQGSHVVITSDTPGITHPVYQIYKFEGGSEDSNSRVFVEIDSFSKFNQPNRFLKTFDRTGKESGLAQIRQVSYYIEEPIKDINGNTIGFKNFDKYCTVIIDDGQRIYRDSLKNVYVYELFKIPFGRFSIFPIRDMDFDFTSEEYSDEKELTVEEKYYKTFDPLNILTHKEIEDFYLNKEFTSLQSVLEKEDGDTEITSPKIKSEYDRLQENYLPQLSVPSRITPYINKWVFRNGLNVRETDYRLTSSEAFGLTNFSPSADEFTRNPDYFTHEWYYLQKLPLYYGLYDRSELNKVFSYFPDALDVTSNGLLNVDQDYFTEYFTVDYQKYPILGTDNKLLSEELVAVDKQIRYSIFEEGHDQNFASTFFRGVKVTVKQRVENLEKIDYNLQNIRFKRDTRFNDYKFTCVLIPHNGQYPVGKKRRTIEIEAIENRKHRNITLLIYARIDDLVNRIYKDVLSVAVPVDAAFIDRTILYALNSKFVSINSLDLNTDGTMDYDDILLSGSIDMRAASGTVFGNAIVPPAEVLAPAAIGTVVGTTDSTGSATRFLDEITVQSNGSYNQIIATSGTATRQFKVLKVYADDRLVATNFTGGPQPAGITDFDVKNGIYIYLDGGYNYWENRLANISYAKIAELINNGNPDIKYTTVHEDGSIENDLFTLELQTANLVVKPNYLKPVTDSNKPVNFNLTDTIGYRLDVNENAAIHPLYRHSGKFQPKFVDLIKFIDPYVIDIFDNELERNSQIKKAIRDRNTQFQIDSRFGVIKNLYYHKINDKNSRGVLELNKNEAFKPVYPLIGEIAIDKKDFYTFLSNWDAGYFTRSVTKQISENVIGTRAYTEKKSFFASKIMKIIDQLQIDVFDSIAAATTRDLEIIGNDIQKPGNEFEIVYNENRRQITIDIYLEKRLIEVLANSGIRAFFEKYIRPDLGFGLQTTIDDDLENYIKYNILPRYEIGEVQLYVRKSKDENFNNTFPLINTGLTDAAKINAGMTTVKDFNFTLLSGRSNFNLRLIYNKTSGFNYSIAPSIKIIKK